MNTKKASSRKLAAILPAVLLLSGVVLGGPEKATLAGRILDAGTGKPISEAVIEMRAPGLKAKSEADGRYEIRNLEAGPVTVVFSCPGFVSQTKEAVMSAGEILNLEIALARIKYDAEEFVELVADTRPKEKATLVETVPLSGREILQMPGTAEDLGRALAVLPSVAQLGNLSNDLIVRGGSPFENGYYVDNIPLLNINFFQREGGSGGTYGILGTDVIQDVRFSAGGFSVQYGDRLSSIVDIRLKEGNAERVKSKVDLNVAGFGAAAEGPVPGWNSTFLVSGRISYYGLAARMADFGIEPDFGTLQAKWTWSPSPRHKITFLDIYGACRLSMDLDAAVDYSLNHYLDSWTRQNTAGIDWQWTWDDRGVSRTSLSTTAVKNWDLVRNVQTEAKYLGRDETEWTTVLRNVNLWDAGERMRFEFGFEASSNRADFGSYFASYLDKYGNLFSGFGLDGNFRAEKAGLFLGATFQLTSRLAATAGLRGDYFSFNRHLLFSPRFSLSYSLTPRWTIIGSFGVFRQFLYALMLARNPNSTGLRDPRAFHAVLGTEYVFNPSTRLTVEVYSKEYRDFPLTPDDPYLFLVDNNIALSGFTYYKDVVDSGRASARGVEILLHKKLREKLYGLAGVSIFSSRYRDLTGIWRNRISDNRVLVSLVGGYAPGHNWDYSFRWSYGGGIPYSPFDPVRSLAENVGIVDETRIQAERLPAYHSLALRVDRRFHFRRSVLSVYFSVSNAYNRKNVARYYWNRTNHVIEPVYHLPILPILGVAYEF